LLALLLIVAEHEDHQHDDGDHRHHDQADHQTHVHAVARLGRRRDQQNLLCPRAYRQQRHQQGAEQRLTYSFHLSYSLQIIQGVNIGAVVFHSKVAVVAGGDTG